MHDRRLQIVYSSNFLALGTREQHGPQMDERTAVVGQGLESSMVQVHLRSPRR